MSTDWMPSRREEQIAMARQWFEFFTNGNFPKWGITAQDAAAVGFIVHNIETAEAESRATGGGTVVMGRLRCSKVRCTFELGVCAKRSLSANSTHLFVEFCKLFL